MRELLFRGKRMDNGEWVEGSFLRDGEAHRLARQEGLPFSDCYIVPKTERDNVRTYLTQGILLDTIAYHVIPATVGQYTGLKDKNGKRIFEGDICRNTRTGEIVSVKWHGTMAGFVWSKRRNDNSHLSDFGELFRAYDKYEVIGNIYYNPELLEE